MSAVVRYALLVVVLFAAGGAMGQISSCKIITKDSTGCTPLFISDSATETTSSPIVERIWYLTTCTGTSVYSTPPGGLNATFSYIIDSSGCYCLRLWSKNQDGDTCSTSICNITAAVKPSIAFTFTPALLEGCKPFTVQAQCDCTPGSGIINSIVIDWGCGPPFTTLTACNSTPITYTYSNCPPGAYTPTVIVSNNYNCFADTTYPDLVTVIPDPVADFTADTTIADCATSPLDVHFTATVSDPHLTYTWYINNVLEQSSASNLFSYSFPVSANCYNIKLVVTHPSGCSDSITKSDYICVRNTPLISFSASDTVFCLPQTVVFTNTSPGIPSLTWTLTGGTPPQTFTSSTGATYSADITVAGTYIMKGVGVFSAGCADSVTMILQANPSPTSNFTESTTTSCKSPFTVDYTPTNPCAGCTYLWASSGGVPPCCQTTQDDAITYSPVTSPTTYSMKLIVTNSFGCTSTTVQSSAVTYRQINPQITASGYQGCGPICITLYNTTDTTNLHDTIASVCWSFPGSGIPGGCKDTIQRCFTTVGCYSVKLTITTLGGCADSITLPDTICAANPPTCSLVIRPDTICFEQDTVGFTLTCDSFSFCKVNFGDGPGFQTFFTPHFTHNYQSIGNLCTTVVVYKDSCASDTLSGCVQINAPIANFGDSFTCNTGNVVYFVNSSTMATNYEWYFCNGDSSNLMNPSQALNYCDTCTVTLVAYNSTTGCHHHKSETINTPCDSSSFSPADTIVGCTGLKVTFNNTSLFDNGNFTRWVVDTVGGINWFGPGSGGTNQFIYTFDTPGVYVVAMRNEQVGGCVDTVYRNVYICGITSTFTFDTSCFPLPICFHDSTINYCSSTTATWSWNFGDNTTSTLQNPCHSYTAPGTYTTTLITSNGVCGDTLAQSVATSQVVSINFQIDTIVCPGYELCVTNNSTGIDLLYNWSAPGATPSSSTSANPCFTYATPIDTFIQLQLTSNGQCSFDSTIPIHARYPVAGGYASRNFIICPNPPVPVNFTDTSLYVDSTVLWNFGDGNQTNDKNPSHIYIYPGTYIVTLSVLDNSGCADTTVIDTITVAGPFGQVTVTPTLGACSCKDSVHYNISTYNAVNLTFSYGCGLGSYTTAITPVGTIADPTVIDLAFLYCLTDSCMPLALVQDSLACKVQIPTTFVPVDSPVVNFTFNSYGVCQAGTVCFTDSTVYHLSANQSFTVQWLWSFGDGTTDTAQNPCHYYAQPGVYSVNLQVTSNLGCVDTSLPQQLIIPSYPVAGYFAGDSFVCAGSSICFHDTSVIYPFTGPAFWTWDFGDGSPIDTVYTRSICHTYDSGGSYTVTLCVYDSLGCSNCDSSAAMTVIGNPVADAGGNLTICYGVSTQLNGSGGLTYSWSPPTLFSSPDSSNPFIVLDQDTMVTLVVANSYGCMDTDSASIVVARVIANFNTSLTVCANDTFCVSDASTGTNDSIIVWSYNFGDGTVLTGPNDCHSYVTPGNYNITLSDTDNHGCTDSLVKPITVYSVPEAEFSLNDTAICSNKQICVTDLSTSATPIVSWYWNFGDNTTDTDQNPLCHLYSPPYSPDYTIILVVTDQHNCRDSALSNVTVYTVPTANFTWRTSCENDSMPLTNTSTPGSSPIISCLWTLWLGAPSPVLDSDCFTDFLFPPGQHNVQLVVGDLNGCYDTVVETVLTDSLSQLSVFPGDTVICLGSSVDYTVGGTYTSITWVPSSWLSNPDSPIVIINPLATIGYLVIATNGVCPSAVDTFVINVLPPPSATAAAQPPQIVLGESSNIYLSILIAQGTIDSIVWSPDSTLNCRTCQNPVATPKQTTAYTATIYYSYMGVTCTTTAQTTVEVLNVCDQSLIYTPNTFTPNGDGKNDVFVIRGDAAVAIKYFRIFDRWGRLVFDEESGLPNNLQYGWNGEDMEGKKLNPDVFVYMYQIQCANGDIVTGQGNITLVR